MTMFFKRKKWRAAPSWEQVQKAQARRLADWLNRKVATVPVKKKRLYVKACLAGVVLLYGTMAWYAIQRHRTVSESATLTRWQFRTASPLKAWLPDDKLYDSLKKEWPGLADSLEMLERLH
jgi:hypothetical protein